MPIHNNDIAEQFNRTADLLEIQGANPFRVRAYRNAARTVGSLCQNVKDLLEAGEDLSKLPGIGKDLAGKIREIAESGMLSLLQKLHKEIPEELANLMQISGLGAKRIAILHKELKINSMEDLQKAAENKKVREIEGLGPKTEEAILKEIERLKSTPARRSRLDKAEQIAFPLMGYLKQDKSVKDIEIAGSFRRRKETVRDLDILATCRQGSDIMDRFTKYEDVEKIIAKGNTKSSVLLRGGFQVDLRVIPQAGYGSALMYFTGSKEHNIALRKMCVKKNWKLNEYGLFRGKKRLAGQTEKEVYDKLGLVYIEPELRENRGEIEQAMDGSMPLLVDMDDLRGDLHVHSDYTDGKNTIAEMAEKAQEMGYDYVAITDHSKRVTVAGGLKPKDVKRQIKEIDEYNKHKRAITVLKGTEVDILKDGKLDLPDKILEQLDVVVCSVHSYFNLSKKEQTERVIGAMKNPHFQILGHPTGRLIGEREPYELDMEKIMKAARKYGVCLELNAHPDRLDLNDIYCKMAKDMGVKVVISTDSHRTGHLELIRYGIWQARRGWLEKKDVLNTKTLKQLRSALRKK